MASASLVTQIVDQVNRKHILFNGKITWKGLHLYVSKSIRLNDLCFDSNSISCYQNTCRSVAASLIGLSRRPENQSKKCGSIHELWSAKSKGCSSVAWFNPLPWEDGARPGLLKNLTCLWPGYLTVVQPFFNGLHIHVLSLDYMTETLSNLR